MPYTVNSKKFGKVRIKDTTNIARLSKAPQHAFPMVGYPNAYDWKIRESLVYNHEIKLKRAREAEIREYGGVTTAEYRMIMEHMKKHNELLETLPSL